MAIEFSCPHCQHLLRTADDKAGLSAKCPACSEVIWVPYSTDSDASESAASAPEATESADPPEPDVAPQEIGIPLAKEPGPDPLDELASASADDATGANETPQDIPRRRSAPEIVCPGCQATNEPGTQNCRFCGTSLEGVEPVDQSEPRPIPSFDVGEIMVSAWKLYTQELGLMLGATVIMTFLPALVILPCVIPIGIAAAAAAAAGDEEAILLIVIPAVIILLPVLLALGAAMQLGQTKLYLNIARGDGPSIGDLFWGFKAEGRPLILPALLVMVAVGALMLVGTILCCAPGILVMLSAWPALPLLVDRRLTGSDAIGQTIEFCKRELGQVLGVGAIAMGLQMLPSFIPYIGVILQLFAIPLAQLLIAIGYLRMSRQPTQFERWKRSTTRPASGNLA